MQSPILCILHETIGSKALLMITAQNPSKAKQPKNSQNVTILIYFLYSN
jgi:hypothetical protein